MYGRAVAAALGRHGESQGLMTTWTLNGLKRAMVSGQGAGGRAGPPRAVDGHAADGPQHPTLAAGARAQRVRPNPTHCSALKFVAMSLDRECAVQLHSGCVRHSLT